MIENQTTENQTTVPEKFNVPNTLYIHLLERVRTLQNQVIELLVVKHDLLYIQTPALISNYYAWLYQYDKKVLLFTAKKEQCQFEINEMKKSLNGVGHLTLKDILQHSKQRYKNFKKELKKQKKQFKQIAKIDKCYTLSNKKWKRLCNLYKFIRFELNIKSYSKTDEAYRDKLRKIADCYYNKRNLRAMYELSLYVKDCNLNDCNATMAVSEIKQVIYACHAAREKLQIQINQIEGQFPFTHKNDLQSSEYKNSVIREYRKKIQDAKKEFLRWFDLRNGFLTLCLQANRGKNIVDQICHDAVSAPRVFNSVLRLITLTVAGTTHVPDIVHYAQNLAIGDKLSLLREPNNEYDSNAIMVLNQNEKKIGYIPKNNNPILAAMLDQGALLYAEVKSVELAGTWVKIVINIFLQN